MEKRLSSPNPTIVRIIVFGAMGRMGSRILDLARADDRFRVVAGVDRDDPRTEASNHVRASNVREPADIVVDFSSSDGALRALTLARECGAALLVGTTALADSTLAALRDESSRRAILVAPNTSLGVAVLARLVADAAKFFGPGYQCSIIEAHHIRKKDAPSGTALRLANAARSAGASLPDSQILAVRGGDIVGDHTVIFAGPGECIELRHSAVSRDLFAAGALHAAAWLAHRGPGWWTMEDVLGLPSR